MTDERPTGAATLPAEEASPHAEAMMAFILRLRSRGLREQRVLNAVSTLPRPVFVLPDHASLAWGDNALPIQCGQTITPPALVATIAERLDVQATHRVLEIGTGSGYLTAVLARLALRVLTVDRWRTLVTEAEERLRAVEILNVTMMVADGRDGWAGLAPFDRIVSTASVSEIPDSLVGHLADGGRMILPVGPPGSEHRLVMVEKRLGSTRETTIMRLRASPMTPGVAATL